MVKRVERNVNLRAWWDLLYMALSPHNHETCRLPCSGLSCATIRVSPLRALRSKSVVRAGVLCCKQAKGMTIISMRLRQKAVKPVKLGNKNACPLLKLHILHAAGKTGQAYYVSLHPVLNVICLDYTIKALRNGQSEGLMNKSSTGAVIAKIVYI